jgi:hypothetical protein
MNVSFITIFGVGAIILYSIITLLNYYGVQMNSYGIYLSFYTFLFLSAFILPRQVPQLD